MLEVAPGLYLMHRAEEPGLLPLDDIDAIVNLSPTSPNSHTCIVYHRVQCLCPCPCSCYQEAGRFVEGHLQMGRRVAVHCNAGFQRSIPFLAWFLTQTQAHRPGCTLEQAVARMTREAGYLDCVKHVLHHQCS